MGADIRQVKGKARRKEVKRQTCKCLDVSASALPMLSSLMIIRCSVTDGGQPAGLDVPSETKNKVWLPDPIILRMGL